MVNDAALKNQFSERDTSDFQLIEVNYINTNCPRIQKQQTTKRRSSFLYITECHELCESVFNCATHILIRGETGTGMKEVVPICDSGCPEAIKAGTDRNPKNQDP